ncbi:hypothetical protein JCGZ_16217 [Jatropha curcas]|uniref:Non-haem dioxygenase N-terminal domain-containing protein n=1 Tax=Jatropha curcas TaxID=180498 RepID=A0A067K3D9_JATCU|nr:hypothetical protein JCGZ_16217 [Jatropha curcas]
MTLQIPIIDMSKLIDGNEYELAALHTACKNWGFFQLINHGVEEEVIEKMKMDVKEFFKLPLEEKKICAQVPNNIEGYGQAFVVSQEQKLDWGDMLFLLPQPLSQRNMRFCPTNPTSFRATLDEYSLELQRISICLVRFIGRNLGIDPEKLASKFKDGTQGIRMNYYPHCAEAHKIMSNGQYKSIEHRAVVNPEKERLSIAAFHSPNMNAMIGPLEDLIKDEKANYKTVTHYEYIRLVVTRKLDGKSLIGHMKLL